MISGTTINNRRTSDYSPDRFLSCGCGLHTDDVGFRVALRAKHGDEVRPTVFIGRSPSVQCSALNHKFARTDCAFAVFKTHHNRTLDDDHEIEGVGGVHAGTIGVIASDTKPRAVGVGAVGYARHADDTGTGATRWRLECES